MLSLYKQLLAPFPIKALFRCAGVFLLLACTAQSTKADDGYADSFDRADSAALGATSTGNYPWVKTQWDTISNMANADLVVSNNQLNIRTSAGVDTANAYADSNLDGAATYTVSFDFNMASMGSKVRSGFFILPRAQGTDLVGNSGWVFRVQAGGGWDVRCYNGTARTGSPACIPLSLLTPLVASGLTQDAVHHIEIGVTGNVATLKIDGTAVDINRAIGSNADNGIPDHVMLGHNALAGDARGLNAFIDNLTVSSGANTAPIITAQPQNATVAAGQTATFTVTAAWDPASTYQWQKNGTDIAGATSASYTTPATLFADNGALFRCVVSNSAGSVTSGAATVTLNPSMRYADSFDRADSAALGATSTGNYPWVKTQWDTISNMANADLVVSNNQLNIRTSAGVDTANAYADSNLDGAATYTVSFDFNMASMGSKVRSGFFILPRAQGTDLVGNSGWVFRVQAGGGWDVRCYNGTARTGSPACIPLSLLTPLVASGLTQDAVHHIEIGVTGNVATLKIDGTAVDINRAIGSNADNGIPDHVMLGHNALAGDARGLNAFIDNLTVSSGANTAPIITAQPQNATVAAGQTATFTVTAAWDPASTYQWQKNGTDIAGATSASYTTPATLFADNGALFRCVVSNSAGSVTSGAAILSVPGDTDGNGLPDAWEIQYFGATGQNPDAPAPRSDGLTILQAYQQGLNPLDFYNGQLPIIEIAGGNNQTGSPGAFVSSPLIVRVTDNLNHLLPNAPVTFTVTQGGTLQATASGTIAAALTVKTNAYGRAIVYFQLPNTPNAQFQIAARPATGRYSNSVLFVENSDAGSGSHGTPTLPPDNPQGGGGNPPANNPPQIPVQYYAALDISGNNTDGENVTSVALDDNNHAAFAYMESGGHLIAKKWANGAVDSSFSNQTPMPDTVTLSLTWGRESMDYDFDRTLEYNYCVNASGTIYGTVLYRPKDNGPTEFGLGMTFTDSTAMPIDLFKSLTLLGYNEMAHDDENLVVLGCSANTYYGFTFHSGLWPDMGYVSKSGITTLFVANDYNGQWNPQESDTLKINYADGWFYPFMASDNGWAAGERSQGGLWGGARTPAVWNANQEKVTDLGENNWPVGVNNQGYVLCGGSSGSNKATLWHADSSTDLKDLLPADYKSMLDSIKPKLISNADSGNAVNILFNATEIASGAAHDYVLQALTSGTNTLAQISLPDGVNADFHSLNASGIISSIGTLTTGTNASASTSAKKAILLLPVDIVVRKKGTSAAPDDGLLVKKGDLLEFALAPQYFDQPKQFENLITWKYRQLKGDGSLPTQWTAFGNNGKGTKFEDAGLTALGGIYQFKAVITTGGQEQDYQYVRSKDAKYGADSGGTYNPIYRKDQRDYVGVADAQWQIDLRNAAKGLLGSTAYAEATHINVFPGGPNTAGSPKCNIFVYHMGNASGATVPLTHPYKSWTMPPLAKQWDDGGYTIPGWMFLGTSQTPQPGQVVSRRVTGSILGISYQVGGHVGILDYDGAWINAGSKTVNKYPHLTSGDYQPAHERKK